MTEPRRIFAASFVCVFGFALVLLALVYAAIPPLNQVVPATPSWPGIAHWSKGDIAGAILGGYAQRWLEIPILLLTCALAAFIPTRFALHKQRQKAALYNRLTEAYGQQHGIEAERRRLKETLNTLAPQVRALAQRLALLERRQGNESVLDRAEYETPDARSHVARDLAGQFKSGLEALESELVLACAALAPLQDVRPQPTPARPHDLAERLKRFSLNATLAAVNAGEAYAPLADEAKALAAEMEQMQAPQQPEDSFVPEALNTVTAHLAAAAGLIDDQWMLISAMNRDEGTGAFGEALGALAKQAGELEEKILQFTQPPKRKAA